MAAGPVFRDLQSPTDPLVGRWHALLSRVFAAEPNFIPPLEHVHRFLELRARGRIAGHCLALVEGEEVVGGSLFRYLPEVNTAFSGYLFLDPAVRGRGYGRRMVTERRRILQTDARAHGHPDIDALFIDVVAPDRMPPAALERERRIMDPWERRVFMARMGFFKVDIPFFQPPLGPGREEVPWLDLLCCPVRPEWAERRAIPGDVIVRTLTELWSSYLPNWQQYIGRISAAAAGREVPLLDPVPPRPGTD